MTYSLCPLIRLTDPLHHYTIKCSTPPPLLYVFLSQAPLLHYIIFVETLPPPLHSFLIILSAPLYIFKWISRKKVTQFSHGLSDQ